jgi:hypothetical protein
LANLDGGIGYGRNRSSGVSDKKCGSPRDDHASNFDLFINSLEWPHFMLRPVS